MSTELPNLTRTGMDDLDGESTCASATTCAHARLKTDILDQTLGVLCADCGTVLAYCWGDTHVPESMWNRAADQDPNARRCDQSRDDVCGVCQEAIE